MPNHVLKRMGFLLVAVCAAALVLSQTPAEALVYPGHWENDDQMVEWARSTQERRKTAIMPSWVDKFPNVTRADLAAAVPTLAPYGYDEDFIRCSVEGTITVQSGDQRRWYYRVQGDPSGTITWVPISQFFKAGATIRVFKYGNNAFVAKACANFGGRPVFRGTLRVIKFDDSNMNGAWDGGEQEVSGWPVSYSGPQSGNGVTRLVREVKTGAYTVSEGLLAHWMHTTPSSVSASVRACDTTTVKFGNVRLADVTVHKFHDLNNNGAWDAGEPPLAGWPICLTGTWVNGTPQPPVPCQNTDGAGQVTFRDLPPGTYTVREAVEFVGPCEIADLNDCRWRATTPTSRTVVLPEGQDITADPFGNIALGPIIKTVLDYWWRTPIADACITISEINIPGTVLANCPPLPRTKCTTETGQVTFADLLPGQYGLSVELPEPYLPWPDTLSHEVDVVVTDCPAPPTYNEDYAYDNPDHEPRTLGFWINWRLRYSESEMAALIERVKVASEDFGALTVGNIDAYLSPAGKKPSAEQMATCQYLALWLNLASDRLGFLPEVDISSIARWDTVVNDTYETPGDGVLSIQYLMLELRAAYNGGSLSQKQWEALKDICDAVNNHTVFLEPPTGPID